MKRRIGQFVLLCGLCLSLAGCWDYSEIESRDFALGVGVDHLEPNLVLVTEVIKASGAAQDVKFEPVVLSIEGRTLLSGDRALTNPAGLVISWPHAMVFVVSEEVARQGILPAIELVLRGRELRSTVSLFVARDCTVEEIFKSKPPLTNTVSDHLVNVVDHHAWIPVFFPQKMWQFVKNMVQVGICAVVPTIQLVEVNGESVPIIEGTAIFSTDAMVAWLDGEESRILTLLTGLPYRGTFVVNKKTGDKETPLPYEILGNLVKIEPVVEGDRLGMKIDLHLQVDLPEVGSAQLNFQDQSVVLELEQELSAAVTQHIEEFLSKIHKEHQVDPLGLGLLLKRTNPKVWRSHAEDWEKTLGNLDISVQVTSRIVFSGVISKFVPQRD